METRGHRFSTRHLRLAALLTLPATLVACSASLDDSPAMAVDEATTPRYRVLVANDLGMHCYDSDYSIFSLLPPFNTLQGQVVDTVNRRLLTSADVNLRYVGVADPAGRINTTSVGKTNFWTHAPALFGVNLAADMGLAGQKMPGASNAAQLFARYDSTTRVFTAAGIPVTSRTNAGATSYYPMFRVQAVSKTTGSVLGYTDAVAPVSDEMNCSTCHNTGGTAARAAGVAWSANTNLDLQYRENVLKVHDLRHATNLWNTRPVLCASCHYSPALDLAGTGPTGNQVGRSYLSFAMHGRHGRDANNATTGAPIISGSDRAACYSCHPGSTTRCLRGAMGNAGMQCQSCHGTMLAVAGAYLSPSGTRRTPWLSETRCQSCHTGDAVNHQTVTGQMATDNIRTLVAYASNDPSATPRLAPGSRYAENASLYRNSRGHGGVLCEGCHNSTHAEWPSSETNDNLTPTQVQGHGGVISECSACHTRVPTTATGGPHGMHTIGAAWVSAHERYAESNPASCRPCHGTDARGTVLSRTAAARSFSVEGRTVRFAARQMVTCYNCHNGPNP